MSPPGAPGPAGPMAPPDPPEPPELPEPPPVLDPAELVGAGAADPVVVTAALEGVVALVEMSDDVAGGPPEENDPQAASNGAAARAAPMAAAADQSRSVHPFPVQRLAEWSGWMIVIVGAPLASVSVLRLFPCADIT